MTPILCAACRESLEKALLTCPSCGESTLLTGSDGARWILLKVLGKGSFGCTWQAAAFSSGPQVTIGPAEYAIKEIPVAGMDLNQRELLEREALKNNNEGVCPASFADFAPLRLCGFSVLPPP